MSIVALALIAAGVLLTAGSALAQGFDFAVSVRPGWHVTVFPSPIIGVLVFMSGVVALLTSHVSR